MKLLIVAPHFPPSSLPPAQRVRLLLVNLPKLNVNTTIVTTYPKYREEKEDPWMLELIGDKFDLLEIKSLSQRVTRKVGVGDLGLRMLPFLFLSMLKNTRNKKIDFVLYPVPPWYILIVAPFIKKITGIPYGIDFIDPWVEGGELPVDASLKRKISQWVARKLELFVCKEASIIYAVSEGILEQLRKRHGILKEKKMLAVPYGAEVSDFDGKTIEDKDNSACLVRYIGAIWDDAYPVIRTILEAFSKSRKDFTLEFYGTSYAGEGLAQSHLNKWIEEFELKESTSEIPDRVAYKEAVRLTLESNILMLFGGMQSYYAASKLFGLIVSEKPFFAFLHRDSFPAKVLRELNFNYLIEYSNITGDLPDDHLEELKDLIDKLMSEYHKFTPIDINNNIVKQYTAFGMTKAFVNPIKEFLNEKL